MTPQEHKEAGWALLTRLEESIARCKLYISEAHRKGDADEVVFMKGVLTMNERNRTSHLAKMHAVYGVKTEDGK